LLDVFHDWFKRNWVFPRSFRGPGKNVLDGSIAGKIECCSCCLQECIGPCGVNQVLFATARVYAWGEPRKNKK
jgi:hypothetical protein